MGRAGLIVAGYALIAGLGFTTGYAGGPYFSDAYTFLAKTLAGVIAKVKELERRVDRLERSVLYVRECVVKADRLRIRTGPGLDYRVSGYLFRGSVVRIHGQVGEWLRISGGYIHSKYCEVVGDEKGGGSS